MIRWLRRLRWRLLIPKTIKRRLFLFDYTLSKYLSKAEMTNLEDLIHNDDWWELLTKYTETRTNQNMPQFLNEINKSLGKERVIPRKNTTNLFKQRK